MADWGTACHEVAAFCGPLKEPAEKFPHDAVMFHNGTEEVTIEVTDEMREHANFHLLECAKRVTNPEALVWWEQSIDIEFITGEEGGRGTSDFVAYDPATKTVDVIDLKTGQKRVPASSPQLAIYAAGVYNNLFDVFDVDVIRCTIVQSRHGTTDTFEYTPETLGALVDEAREAADAHRSKSKPATPTYEGCKWCARKTECEAYKALVDSDVAPTARRVADFGDMTAAPVGDLLARYQRIDMIELYVEALKKEVARRVSSGDTSLGLKYVRGRKGPRQWVDAAEVLKMFRQLCAGGRRDIKMAQVTKKSPLSPTQLVKILPQEKHPRYWAKLLPLVKQSDGALSLVPMDDPRPAVTREAFVNLESESENGNSAT